MKTSKIIFHSEKNNSEETLKKVAAGKLLRYLLVILMFSSITLLQSCYVLLRTPGHERHGGNVERHDNGRHEGNDRHN